jgi:uncharacterized membrane protein YfcA
MNPTFLWVQAICLAVACAIVGLTPAHLEALALGAALAAYWLVLYALYTAALRGAARSPAGAERHRQDRRVRRQVAVTVTVGVLAGAAGGAAHSIWLSGDEQLAICFGALACLAGFVYASSLADWYVIRPRIDGIVREPPWRTSGESVWRNVTRGMYLHRSIAELLVSIALVAALTGLVDAVLAPPPAATVAIGTGAVTVLLVLLQRAISTLRHQVLDEPDFWIGDVLKDEQGRLFYLLSVEVGGIRVREWDPMSGTWGRARKINHKALDDQRYVRLKLQDCASARDVAPDPA